MSFDLEISNPFTTGFDGQVTNIFTPRLALWRHLRRSILHPDSPGGAGAFCAHLGSSVAVGSIVTRGQVIGEIIQFDGIPTHLRHALGGRRNNVYPGMNLYDYFVSMAGTAIALHVRFFQDGSAPQVIDYGS
ncbi:hypothetical protein [Nonomuraea fuscirosea]|uniref:hypothetical protein n=1 Tax=Nonomuraea fuscirosea TaxID=1291556 RepID=UPI0033E02EEB